MVMNKKWKQRVKVRNWLNKNNKIKTAYNIYMERKLFKIEIEGNLEDEYVHVNIRDNLYEGEKRRWTSIYVSIQRIS